MKWEPIDIIRLTALLGGFILCGLGTWLMWLGVGAEGVVDIKSSLLSGSIKSGSAGLFLIFFGFSIVLFVLATLSTIQQPTIPTQKKEWSSHTWLGFSFFVLVVIAILFGAMAALGHGEGFAAIAIFSGIMSFFAGMFFVLMSHY